MLEKITRNWWMFALRGLVAVIFGTVALIMPEQTLQALILAFGAFALVDGVFTVIAGIRFVPTFSHWWAVLLEGVVGILVGLAAIFLPESTGRALVYLIGAWGLITGIFEIMAAVQFRRVITGESMLILGGLLSMVFGVLLFAFPGAGAVSLVWMVGFYAVIFGVSEITFALRLFRLRRGFEKAGAASF